MTVTDDRMQNDVALMKAKLWVLARAWRLAWSDFDGRTLRHQIEEIIGDTPADIGLNDAPGTHGADASALRAYMDMNGICLGCGCWHNVCGCENGRDLDAGW